MFNYLSFFDEIELPNSKKDCLSLLTCQYGETCGTAIFDQAVFDANHHVPPWNIITKNDAV